jgi:hypothetical protein
MKRSSTTSGNNRCASAALASLILLAALRVSVAAGDSITQVECTMPDGHVVEVPNAAANQEAALLADNETLRCALQEGRTTFVIKLPAGPLRDRFTFVNENAAAAGKLKISVSNDPLPADSSKWVDVDGDITFKQKRLFNVSTLGVEARYLKLSFEVAKDVRIAAVGR